jgi:hypothetical protein
VLDAKGGSGAVLLAVVFSGVRIARKCDEEEEKSGGGTSGKAGRVYVCSNKHTSTVGGSGKSDSPGRRGRMTEDQQKHGGAATKRTNGEQTNGANTRHTR